MAQTAYQRLSITVNKVYLNFKLFLNQGYDLEMLQENMRTGITNVNNVI